MIRVPREQMNTTVSFPIHRGVEEYTRQPIRVTSVLTFSNINLHILFRGATFCTGLLFAH